MRQTSLKDEGLHSPLHSPPHHLDHRFVVCSGGLDQGGTGALEREQVTHGDLLLLRSINNSMIKVTRHRNTVSHVPVLCGVHSGLRELLAEVASPRVASYDWVAKSDTDTYVVVPNLLQAVAPPHTIISTVQPSNSAVHARRSLASTHLPTAILGCHVGPTSTITGRELGSDPRLSTIVSTTRSDGESHLPAALTARHEYMPPTHMCTGAES